MKRQKGIALILAIGILAVLSVLATTFALNMRLEYKIAVNYYNRVKARYIAEAALQMAIGGLRVSARVTAFDFPRNLSCSISAASEDGFHSGTAAIEDEQGKLNVSNCTEGVLENLIRILRTYAGVHGVSVGDAKKIVDVRPASGFSHLEDIIVQSKIAGTESGIDAEKLRLLRPYITVHGYEDPNDSNRSPVNINSASREVIAAAIYTNTTTVMDSAWLAAGQIIRSPEGSPDRTTYTDWLHFNSRVDEFINRMGWDADFGKEIKDTFNPNTVSSAADVTRFCFHPGGYYRVTATGTTADLSSSETVSCVVEISRMYVETTKEQFLNGTTNDTTIADTCPIYPVVVGTNPDYTRPDAIKLGFWDDFDETDVSGIGWSSSTGTFEIRDEDADGDKELVQTSSYGLFVPPIQAEDFYFNAFFDDLSGGIQMKNVGWLLFRGITPGSPCAIHNRTGMLEWGGAWAYDVSGAGEIQFLTNSVAAGMGLTPADRYIYPAAIRQWPDDNQDSDSNRTLYAYSEAERQIEVRAYNSNARLKVRTDQPYQTYNKTSIPITGTGDFGLYGDSSRVAWDNVRIIGPSGTFTSQTFNPPEGVVEWGTITGTLSHPDEGDVTLSVVTGSIIEFPLGVSLSSDPYVSIGGSSNSIYWDAAFTQEGVTDLDKTMRCPILEDVTITYLPKTQLVSYAVY